ncbi:hypothetical protein [Endozoicomonas sp. Mp262]|uniref:hypothetical protein n=1 Tax=Endozoicomonas sp. Mp262 TaxID=2919499 RepID=UPI0021DB7542
MKLRLYSQILLGLFLIASFCTSNAGPGSEDEIRLLSAAFIENNSGERNGDIQAIFMEDGYEIPTLTHKFAREQILNAVQRRHEKAIRVNYLATGYGVLVVKAELDSDGENDEVAEEIYVQLKFRNKPKAVELYTDGTLKLSEEDTTDKKLVFERVNIMGAKPIIIPLTRQSELADKKWCTTVAHLAKEQISQLKNDKSSFENDEDYEKYKWCWTSLTEQNLDSDEDDNKE